MPTFRVVPWQHEGELRDVGDSFFRKGSLNASNEALIAGCEHVTAWQHRGHVPHAVNSTSALARAVVLDRASSAQEVSTAPPKHKDTAMADSDRQSAPPPPPLSPERAAGQTPLSQAVDASVLSAVYASAFSSFVTGYLDNQQTGLLKRSMFDLAVQLGMPREFVSARHAVAHEGGGLSLIELRRLARAGLEWIYERYWRDILGDRRHALAAGPHDASDGDFEIQVERVLEEYEAARGALGKAQLEGSAQDLGKREPMPVAKTTKALVGLGLRGQLVHVLVRSMLSERHMGGVQVEGYVLPPPAVRLWQPLLLSLTVVSGFLEAFVQGAVEMVCDGSDTGDGAERNPQGDNAVSLALIAWLLHICNAADWALLRQTHVSLEYILERCEASSGTWPGVLVALVRGTRIAEEQHVSRVAYDNQEDDDHGLGAIRKMDSEKVWQMIDDGRLGEILA